MAAILNSLRGFESAAPRPRDHVRLADSIADADPFTILLFTEPLAQGHWGRKRYMDMRRVQICSEIDETIFRQFRPELDERSDYLKDHRDPDDTHLECLWQEYRPKARISVWKDREPDEAPQ